jgi:hypothetical protein
MSMRFKTVLLLLAFVLPGIKTYAETNLSDCEVLQRIFEAAKKNERLTETYGFWEENTTKKLSDEGSVKKQERRKYRTIWIENQPYAELVEIDGKPLTKKQTEEEHDRQEKYAKSLHQHKEKDSDDVDLTWEDLYEKYDFTALPSEENAAYVFSFRPKTGKQKERNRVEKIFNHLSGKLWADQNFNLMKAEAQLETPVTFGWGILARVDRLQMQYFQKPFHDVWLPTSLHIAFKAKIALLRMEKQEIDSRFYNPFLRPGGAAHGSSP